MANWHMANWCMVNGRSPVYDTTSSLLLLATIKLQVFITHLFKGLKKQSKPLELEHTSHTSSPSKKKSRKASSSKGEQLVFRQKEDHYFVSS